MSQQTKPNSIEQPLSLITNFRQFYYLVKLELEKVILQMPWPVKLTPNMARSVLPVKLAKNVCLFSLLILIAHAYFQPTQRMLMYIWPNFSNIEKETTKLITLN